MTWQNCDIRAMKVRLDISGYISDTVSVYTWTWNCGIEMQVFNQLLSRAAQLEGLELRFLGKCRLSQL